MEKQQAASFLGVSVRSLERYTSQGKLSVTYQRGTNGNVATYDPAELEQFKAVIGTAVTKPATAAMSLPKSLDMSLARVADVSEAVNQLVTILDALGYQRSRNKPTVSLETKLLLKLDEAQALTGLSRERLREAIRNGQLQACKIGHTYRIKQTDLAEYVQAL